MNKEKILKKAEEFGIDISKYPLPSLKKIVFLTEQDKELGNEFIKAIKDSGFFDGYDMEIIQRHLSNFLAVYLIGKGKLI